MHKTEQTTSEWGIAEHGCGCGSASSSADRRELTQDERLGVCKSHVRDLAECLGSARDWIDIQQHNREVRDLETLRRGCSSCDDRPSKKEERDESACGNGDEEAPAIDPSGEEQPGSSLAKTERNRAVEERLQRLHARMRDRRRQALSLVGSTTYLPLEPFKLGGIKANMPLVPDGLGVKANTPIVAPGLEIKAKTPSLPPGSLPPGLGVHANDVPQAFDSAAPCPGPPPRAGVSGLAAPICQPPLLDIDITGMVGKPWTAAVVQDLVDVAQECLAALWTAWHTLKRILDCNHRHQVQWWFWDADTSPNKYYTLSPLETRSCYLPIALMESRTRLAGARLTQGRIGVRQLPRLRFEPEAPNLCPKFGIIIQEFYQQNSDEIRICGDWLLLDRASRKERLLAALCSMNVSDQVHNPELILLARWIIGRHDSVGYSRASGLKDWDPRAEASRKPMLAFMRTYTFEKKMEESKRDRVREAWGSSWPWVESGWRRLWRIGLLYMTELETVDQTSADRVIRELWHYGGKRDSNNPRRGGARSSYPGTRDCRGFTGADEINGDDQPVDHDACFLAGLAEKNDALRRRYNVSLNNWFGPYSNRRFLTVYWVICALASRYQGRFLNDYMNNNMNRTKFYSNSTINRSNSNPTGEIIFRNNFFEGSWPDDILGRQQELCHEMMHYLVTGDYGGRPRDVYNPVCDSSSSTQKCYGDDDSTRLAETGDWEAVKNIDNYRGWLYNHYLRWGGDWPPKTDIEKGDVYHPDPITDADWETDDLESITRVPWSELEKVRDAMGYSNWKPFRHPGF